MVYWLSKICVFCSLFCAACNEPLNIVSEPNNDTSSQNVNNNNSSNNNNNNNQNTEPSGNNNTSGGDDKPDNHDPVFYPAGIYVGGHETNTEFDSITDECLEIIRSKKYLLHSRSYGQNLLNGIFELALLDHDRYYISKKQYNLRDGSEIPYISSTSSDPNVPPENAFAISNIVLNLCELPRPKTIPEFESTVRDYYYDDIDVAMLEMRADGDNYDYYDELYIAYTEMLDGLRADFNYIHFIYFACNIYCGDYGGHEDTTTANAFNTMLFADYDGMVPIFDYTDVISTRERSLITNELCLKTEQGWNYPDCECVFEGTNLRTCCQEYNETTGRHPHTSEAELRFGKSLYVLWAKLFCSQAECLGDKECNWCNGETCNNGKCVAGPIPCPSDDLDCTLDCNAQTQQCPYLPMNQLCNDSNPCTDDVCIAASGGGCENIPNDANTCSVAGECGKSSHCNSGVCIATADASLCPNLANCETIACDDKSYMCWYDKCSMDEALQVWLPISAGNINDATGNIDNVVDSGTEPVVH